LLNNFKKKIYTIFHFVEFSRIVKSFEKRNKILKSNIESSIKVVVFVYEIILELSTLVYQLVLAEILKIQIYLHMPIINRLF
jgi:hypothetical protein